MMPCASTVAPAPRLRRQASVYGDSEPAESQTRVEVPVSLHLTGAELVGLFVFSPNAIITVEELDDDAWVLEFVQYLLANTTVRQLEEWAGLVGSLVESGGTAGLPVGAACGLPYSVRVDIPAGFLAAVRRTVTRVFGVIA